MQTEVYNTERIKQQGLLPLFYHADADACKAVVHALYDAGVRVIEFTNRGEKAHENFKSLIKEKEENMPDMLLAAGTIKTSDDAKKFIDAGADILISPVFDHSVCDTAYMQKILWIPGCMTPTEIHQAETAGCTMIKLFPGNLLGPSFVTGIRPLFQKLDFIVTGGVDTTKESIHSWFKAGVCAVGMGSKLIMDEGIANKEYALITSRTKEILQVIKNSD